MIKIVSFNDLYLRLTFYNTGDTASFQTKVKEQLQLDVTEAQQEYTTAIQKEQVAKADYQRRQFLKDNPKEVKSAADRALVRRETSHYKSEFDALRKKRKEAKKEADEAFKALDTHKEEESKGFVRENDITKENGQYKTLWTHLPR